MTNTVSERIPAWQWLLSIVGCCLGFAAAVVILRLGMSQRSLPIFAEPTMVIEDPAAIGTIGRFEINGQILDQHLPRMDWTIEPGGMINGQTVNGPIKADFTVTFNSGPVRKAYMGVQVQGGSVILMRDGRVLLSTYADQKPVRRMTTAPESFGPHQQHVQLKFKGDGTEPMRVRALWRPVDAEEPTLLPSEPALIRAGNGTADERGWG